MINSISFVKGLLVFMFLFSINMSNAQVDKKASTFEKKGHDFYSLFQKEKVKNSTNETKMVNSLKKAEIYFNRALVLYQTSPTTYDNEIKKIKLYLRIISYYYNSAQKERTRLFSSN